MAHVLSSSMAPELLLSIGILPKKIVAVWKGEQRSVCDVFPNLVCPAKLSSFGVECKRTSLRQASRVSRFLGDRNRDRDESLVRLFRRYLVRTAMAAS
jgi:hypothetical protein